MVGLSDLFWVYQNSGPALLLALLAGGVYVYRHDIVPRLDSLEGTQEDRGDRWQDQELNAQERTMLIDDAHTRADDLEDAVGRLKTRVRAIEQAYAVDHGEVPDSYHTARDNAEADGGDD